jgi:DNA-directed RNA polymerase specialized sigma24 family protein
MDDSAADQLLERAREGDSAAFAELVRAAYPAIYDFLVRMLLDERQAAALGEAVLVRAGREIGSVPPGLSFRAWALGLAHDAALAAPGGGGNVAASLSEAGAFRSRRGTPIPPAVVWEAVAWLEPRQYALLDLHLRQGLRPHEIARILRVTPASARSLLGRLQVLARRVIEASALVAARRHACAGLAGALARAGEPGQPAALAAIADAHTAACRECRSYTRSLEEALPVFASLRPVSPPPANEEAAVAAAAAALARPPGPPPLAPAASAPADFGPAWSGSRGTIYSLSGLAALALVAVALFWPPSPVAVTGRDRGVPPAALADATGPSPTPTATRTPTRSPARGPSPSQTATASETPSTTPAPQPTSAGPILPGAPSATPSPSSAPPPSASATASPTRTATPSPTPCAPILSANVGTVTVPVPSGPGANPSTFFVIQNLGCGSLPFQTSVASGADWLDVRPPAGVITGQSSPPNEYTVSVYVDPTKLPGTGEGTFSGTVQVNGGAAGTVSVTVNATRIGASPTVSEVTACEAEGILTYSARVVDDFGVTSVYVEYQGAASGQRAMSRVAGTSRDGEWRTEFAIPDGFASARVVAVDGASQARFQAAPAPGPCS